VERQKPTVRQRNKESKRIFNIQTNNKLKGLYVWKVLNNNWELFTNATYKYSLFENSITNLYLPELETVGFNYQI